LINEKCKLRCPRCHYFISCPDFDFAGQQPVEEAAAGACRVVALGAKTGEEALNE